MVNWVNICSDNGLFLHFWHQVITYTKTNFLSQEQNLSEVLYKIQTFWKIIDFKILSDKWQPFWSGLNVSKKVNSYKQNRD